MLWSQDHNNGDQAKEFKRKKGRENPNERKIQEHLEVPENQLYAAVN